MERGEKGSLEQEAGLDPLRVPAWIYPVVYLGWLTNPGCHREAELMSHCCIKVWLQSSVKWVHWCWPAGTALILQLPCRGLIPEPLQMPPVPPAPGHPGPQPWELCPPWQPLALTHGRSAECTVRGCVRTAPQNCLAPKSTLGFGLINQWFPQSAGRSCT